MTSMNMSKMVGSVPLASTVAVVLLLALPPSRASGQAASPGQTPPPAVDPASFPDVVARVNGVAINKADLVKRTRNFIEQFGDGRSVPPDIYQRVLEEMVGTELLVQDVESKGLAPADGDVDRELASRKQALGGEAVFQQAIQQQGLSVEEVRSELKRDLGIQKLIESELVPSITVSDEEKRSFYDQNQDQMKRPEQFKAAHILIGVPPEASDDVKTQARTKAESLRGMVEAGQDFAELASRNSDDGGSKNNGGELPWMSPGETVPPFEQAVVALEIGGLSPVVETRFGFHIIQLRDRRDAGVMSYDEVHERIDAFLKQQRLQERIERQIQELRTRGEVEILI